MELNLKRITVVCGHYGSGKTNLSVNLALKLTEQGKSVTISDLDIVNPYFRTADFKELMEQNKVQLVCPQYANTNLDIPVLPPVLRAAIQNKEQTVLVDVGGDDAGAVALGGYSQLLSEQGYTMLYVINRCRYLEENVEEEVRLLRAVEACSRMKVTHLVNNTNLGTETTAQLINDSQSYLQKVSEATGIPVIFTSVKKDMAHEVSGNILPVSIFVKAPW